MATSPLNSMANVIKSALAVTMNMMGIITERRSRSVQYTVFMSCPDIARTRNQRSGNRTPNRSSRGDYDYAYESCSEKVSTFNQDLTV